jgi:hypothetical protein
MFKDVSKPLIARECSYDQDNIELIRKTIEAQTDIFGDVLELSTTWLLSNTAENSIKSIDGDDEVDDDEGNLIEETDVYQVDSPFNRFSITNNQKRSSGITEFLDSNDSEEKNMNTNPLASHHSNNNVDSDLSSSSFNQSHSLGGGEASRSRGYSGAGHVEGAASSSNNLMHLSVRCPCPVTSPPTLTPLLIFMHALTYTLRLLCNDHYTHITTILTSSLKTIFFFPLFLLNIYLYYM